jgi:hypothetical protein
LGNLPELLGDPAVRGAVFEGCMYGVARGLIYTSEALLLYDGARLVVNGTYSYLQSVQVFNFVVFSVLLGSQLVASSTLFHFHCFVRCNTDVAL